jgi:hypothetical protein
MELFLKSWVDALDFLKNNGYTIVGYGAGGYDVHMQTIKKILQDFNKEKIIVLLPGDYNGKYDILSGTNLICLRQCFDLSTKLPNDVLIPSSFGVVAGDDNMDLPIITDKPKISFCGHKYTHYTRTELFDILINSSSIICNFVFTDKPCNGNIEPDIKDKVKLFNDSMKTSEFVFCPRGNGNFSIRFYETLRSGRIPVLLETDNEMPFNRYINWNELCVISVDKKFLIDDICLFHKQNDLLIISKKCKEAFNNLFIKNFQNNLYNEILLAEKELHKIFTQNM